MFFTPRFTALTLSASFALLMAPAIAQAQSTTHELRWGQAGKLPIASYHPVKRACAALVAPVHLSGKTPFITHADRVTECGTDLASKENVEASPRRD